MTSLSCICICIMLFKILLRINGLPLEFSITHPGEKLISTEGVSLLHVNFLQFDARGKRDVTLTFQDVQFSVVIGGWGNTLSALYLGELVNPRDDEYSGSLLTSSEYKPFWISWNSFQVYVGLGSVKGIGLILHGEPQCPIKVIDSTFASNFGETLVYRINHADMIPGNGRFCGQKKSCNTVNILSSVGSESRIECAVICKMTHGCAFFIFNRNLEQCKIFGNDVGTDIVVSEKVYWEC